MFNVVAGILPSGLVVPPVPYLVVLLVGSVAVGGALAVLRPRVTDRVVVGFAPWMVVGAALHALVQLDAAPPQLVPLFAAPAVYVTTFLVAGGVWAAFAAADGERVAVGIGSVGVVTGVVAVATVLRVGVSRGTVSVVYPVAGLVASLALAAGAYWLLGRVYESVPERVGAVGPVVVFGHALDGVSTAIGVDLFGVGERSPLPRAIMEFAGALPTEPVIGSGWLFVLVKLGIGTGVLVLFTDFAEAEPTQANALLGVVAAVGLGPGAHNLLLFTAVGGL
ncbi:DUF63 family protein [Halorientalis litorea]|uniref:DUF63 family protein n=1 Tax=Halorientalis litorea TaxID=2931977 RepID=UPI001FF370DB|nr:DUF63 family protein [Halorientalis litorea]